MRMEYWRYRFRTVDIGDGVRFGKGFILDGVMLFIVIAIFIDFVI